MKKWLFSKKNIIGCICASFGILLYLIGAIDKFWWLITIGLYIASYMIVEEPKTSLKISYIESFEKSQNELILLLNENSNWLPDEANLILHQVQLNLNDLNYFIRKNKEELFPSEDLYSIQNIFEKYLPNIVSKYTQLPKRYAETTIIKEGKTTKDFLLEQLILLSEHFKKVTHSIYENDSKGLMVHGRFLKEKFSTDEWDSLFIENKSTELAIEIEVEKEV